MRFCLGLLIALLLSFDAAWAQDADWEACKSYDAEKSAAACTRIISAAKEPPAALSVAYNNRAIAHLAHKRRLEALADYSEAIRLDPASPKAYFNRALLQAELGRTEAERADLDAAIQLDPGYAKAYAQRGLHRLEAEPAEGLEDIARAVDLTPKLVLEVPEKHSRRGADASPSLAKRLVAGGIKLAEDPAGKARASKAFELALRIEPGNAEARAALALLNQPPGAQPPRPSVPAAPSKSSTKGPPPSVPPPAKAAPSTPKSLPRVPPAAAATTPAAAAPPTASATAGGFALLVGRAAEGNDIGRAPLGTLDECQARCRATAGCGAFSYDAWNKLCLLKKAVTCVRRDPRYTTAVAAGITVRQSTEPSVIDRRRQRAYPHSGYRTVESATFEACGELCLQEDRCEGFNYKPGTKACTLIARPGEYGPENSTEVGIRSQRVSPTCRE